MSRRTPNLLEEYRKKRDPGRTPEPFGGARQHRSHLFVIQKHAAKRLHYDLRLEIDGSLKSWAIPKGPSVHEKRLAVQVEDHPIEYADFEGIIPEGNYGAGAVIIWDRGWYRTFKNIDLNEQLSSGQLEVEIFGFKLRGKWVLTRMAGKDKEWLFLKMADGSELKKELTDQYPESVLSGLKIEELRDSSKSLEKLASWINSVKPDHTEVPSRLQSFMLALSADHPFSDDRWLFEIKYDGVRVMAIKDSKDLQLYSRSGRLLTSRYPEIANALRALPAERFIIDGEIVALDETGRPSFQRLQQRMQLTDAFEIEKIRASIPVSGIFFDCLAVAHYDVRTLPLVKRKECLSLILPSRGVVQHSDFVIGHGEAFFEAASEQRLEGIMAKRIGSRYVGARSKDWLKIKCQLRQEFVIGGYTQPKGSRSYFGALHLGLYEGKKLVYISKVGTGFDERVLKTIWGKLQLLRQGKSPFDIRTPKSRNDYWVEPKLVCEVRFAEWTNDGGIRQPTFVGLREDKLPFDCHRERPIKTASHISSQDRPQLTITNPAKVFWPKEGYTKKDLVAYYETVAPLLLLYLKDRPIVLTRYPEGIEGKSFFQKDAPKFIPDWVTTKRIYSKESEREIDYFIANDIETLRYVVNLGAIPLHVWSSRTSSLNRPDWLILDLDPKEAPFSHVIKVAQILHRICQDLKLPSYIKTSGATGLHILLPLGRQYSHEEARNFARILALLGVNADPDLSTISRPLRSRARKVYIDFGQNGYGRTIVSPFSVRPLPGAPASCPLRWEEVKAGLDPQKFTITTLSRRFSKIPDPLAAVLKDGIDIGIALNLIAGKV